VQTITEMPKSMRPLVKLEDGAGPVGSRAEEAEGLQEEAGAGRAVQRRRVGEAGHAAFDEVQLLRLNMEAQAQAIHGMEQTRVLGAELQRAKAGVAELAAELKVKDIMMQAKDDMLQVKDRELEAKDREMSLLAQAKDREIHTKDLLLQAKDIEISLLRADIARLNAESAAVGASRQPTPAPAAPAHDAARAETLFQEGQRLYGEQRFSEAAEHWGQAALLLHAPSHAHLSAMLWAGRPGVAKDVKRVFELAAAGAALGCAHSKGALGLCLVTGAGVAKDEARGLALGRESEAAGSCFGQFVVGWCYYNGLCVAQDYAEAVRLHRLASAQGHAVAQSNLGYISQHGQGVAQDYAEAVRLYSLAAAQGLAVAQNNLGYMYEEGKGVAQDYAEAVRLYSLAVAQGHASAQFNLGDMFEHGQGDAKNRAEAIRLYRLADAQGYADATAALRRLRA
jgi:TPR repeat protein